MKLLHLTLIQSMVSLLSLSLLLTLIILTHSLPSDHVLVAAPWSQREGEPYLVARIMELLPPISTYSPNSTSISQGKRIRVAYYLRPRDISSRPITDYNLVVATMHSDVIPASYIKAICSVKHKDEIINLNDYRKQEDHFYFNQVSFHSLILCCKLILHQ